MRTTLLLTEHLGYPPISLIDDIINAVNELMYKCTQAMEKYLLERHVLNGKDYQEEIKVGIAKLETLWENSVDRSFDKLELYILRNVLQIPQELIENGSFRLRHHDSLSLEDSDHEQALAADLEAKMRRLQESVKLHKELRRQTKDVRRVLNRIKQYKLLVLTTLKGKDPKNNEISAILQSLSPINESVKFLASQVRSIYLDSSDQCSMERVKDLVARQQVIESDVLSRTRYLNNTTDIVLTNLLKENNNNSSGPDVNTDTSSLSQTLESATPLIKDPDWTSLKNST